MTFSQPGRSGVVVTDPSPTIAVTRGDARTLVTIATRTALSAAERLVVARLAARLGDYDEVVDR